MVSKFIIVVFLSEWDLLMLRTCVVSHYTGVCMCRRKAEKSRTTTTTTDDESRKNHYFVNKKRKTVGSYAANVVYTTIQWRTPIKSIVQ